MTDCCCCFCLEFEEQEAEFCMEFGEVTIIHTGGDIYPGPYRVIPKRREQILDTKYKTLTDDVTVEEVPWIEVSNPEGTTYIIASD